MNEYVALRFDVSPNVGTGHAVRARTFGTILEARGIPHVYVTHHDAVSSSEALGISKRLIYGFSADDGESAWVRNQSRVTHVITDFCHRYNSNSGEYVRQIKQVRPLTVAVIDSMPPHHFVSNPEVSPEIVCTPYLNAENLRQKPSCERWLAGEKYAVLSPMFLAQRQIVNNSDYEQGRYVLVCCGGADENHLSSTIVREICSRGMPEVEIRVVVGSLFASSLVRELEQFVKLFPLNIMLERGQISLAKLISECRFMIGLAGLIRYEAACLGKTALMIQETSEHEDYLRRFETDGLGKIYFLDQPMDQRRFYTALSCMSDVNFVNRLSKFNQNAFDRVDGLGAERCLNALLQNSF